MPSKSKIPSLRREGFHARYLDVCRVKAIAPVTDVRAKNNQIRVLDFVADRLRPHDWLAICYALEADTSLKSVTIRLRKSNAVVIDDADTLGKAKALTSPVILSRYMLRLLVDALHSFLKTNRVVVELHLNGLPLDVNYMPALVLGLMANRSLKILSLERCKIGERGCSHLCDNIKHLKNIETLNLTGCRLNSASMKGVREFVRMQRLKRTSDEVDGIRRIYLNDNPEIGDAGLAVIVEELMEDGWVSEIEVKNCGLTVASTEKITTCLSKNNSIKIFSVERNSKLPESFQRQIQAHFNGDGSKVEDDEKMTKTQLLEKIRELQMSLALERAQRKSECNEKLTMVTAVKDEKFQIPSGFALIKNEELERLVHKETTKRKPTVSCKILPRRCKIVPKKDKKYSLSELQQMLTVKFNKFLSEVFMDESAKCRSSTAPFRKKPATTRNFNKPVTAHSVAISAKTHFVETNIGDYFHNTERAPVNPTEYWSVTEQLIERTSRTNNILYGSRSTIVEDTSETENEIELKAPGVSSLRSLTYVVERNELE